MKRNINKLTFVLMICLIIAGCSKQYPSASSSAMPLTSSQIEGDGSTETVHEGESVQLIRAMMCLDYASMTVAEFNEKIQAMCAEAGTTIFEVLSDVYDHYAVYDEEGEFVATVFSDYDLEVFMETTLSYSAQEIFGEPVHLGSVMYMTLPGYTAKELYQKKEQMSFDEWDSFFEEHIAEINIFPTLFYSIEADIANAEKLLISDRDGKLNDAQESIISFFVGLDEDVARAANIEDVVRLELEKISAQKSDISMSLICGIQGLEREEPSN